jgi:hypothetical protein
MLLAALWASWEDWKTEGAPLAPSLVPDGSSLTPNGRREAGHVVVTHGSRMMAPDGRSH